VFWRILVPGVIGLAVFVLDTFTPLKGAIAVIYTSCIVLASAGGGRRRALLIGLLCALATAVAYLKQHGAEPIGDATVRFAVCLVAIAITTALCALNKVAENRERETSARYRSLFHTAGFPMWESDWSETLAILREAERLADGEDLERWLAERPEWLRRARRASELREMNEQAQRLFGSDRPQRVTGVGRTTFSVHGGDPAVAGSFVRLFRGATVVEFEADLLKPSGETVELIVRVTRLEADKPWTRILAVAVDVTARKEAQVKLDRALLELAHVSRLTTLGQLAAAIVHEVNQPLSAVITYGRSGLRWLAREASEAPETTRSLERGLANASRAAAVIARVRDIARKSAPRPEPIELGALIYETLRLLKREVHGRGVKVRVAGAHDAPVVQGDRVQIQQVLMNLIMNAAQAMEHVDTARRELTIGVSQRDGMAIVSVRDHGGGIADLDAKRIFEPFATTKAQGLGLGLSICRSIVEGHGGRIWAANLDEGAEVAFSLPTKAAEAGRAA
jgi:C4-dicarboxylate-specific signal transduction histidine kinase